MILPAGNGTFGVVAPGLRSLSQGAGGSTDLLKSLRRARPTRGPLALDNAFANAPPAPSGNCTGPDPPASKKRKSSSPVRATDNTAGEPSQPPRSRGEL